MEKIKIAKIVNAVGLRGEVKVYNYSDDRERFEDLDEIIVSGKQETVRKIQGVRYQGNMVILKLEGVNDRNAAEALKESDVYITEDDLRELPEDTFYVRDLIGMKVIDEEGKDSEEEKNMMRFAGKNVLVTGAAVGIGRAFHYAGKLGARLHNTAEEALNSAEYSREDTAYREYLVKLSKVPDRMTTVSGRRHAQERAEFMREFFRRMNEGK